MRWSVIIASLLLWTGPVASADCTLVNARYKQPDSPWWLTFKRVPMFAASNQTAAFYIELPNSGVTLEGAVHRPNGFGAPLWSIKGPCSAESTEICKFVEDDSPAIYGAYDEGITFLDDAAGAAAPSQLLLADLTSNLWYSMYRGDEFSDDIMGGDAFALVGCD